MGVYTMSRQLLIEVEKQEMLQREFDPSKIQTIKENNNGKLVLPVQLQRANAVNANNRWYSKNILVREAEKYQQLIKAKNSMGELDHPDCEICSELEPNKILTKGGWKLIKDISDNEIIATMNIETRDIEYQQIEKKIDQAYKGIMYHIHGKNIDITTTPNHRFLVEDRYGKMKYITALEIYDIIQSGKNPHLKIPKTGNWNCVEQDTFILPAINPIDFGYSNSHAKIEKYLTDIEIDMNLWMEFLGWYISEGCFINRADRNAYAVKITQKKEEGKKLIEAMLDRFPKEFKINKYEKGNGKVDYYIHDIRLWLYLSKLGKSHEKYIPYEFKQLTPPQLEILFNAFISGDGTSFMDREYNVTKAFTTSKQLADDIQEIMLKLGIASNVKTRIPENRMIEDREILAENSRPLYIIRQETSSGVYISSPSLKVEKIEDFDDRVYCVRVANGNFYAQDKNGKCFWSGNSATVSLQNVSHVITEAYWEGDNLMGRIEVLNTPMGMILQSLVESGILIGVSSRAVGSTRRNAQGYEEVMEDLQLLCWDVVSQPSTPGSWVMTEGKGMLDGQRLIDPKVDRMIRFYQSAQEYIYNKNQ